MRLTTSLLFVGVILLNASIINCWESYELDLFDLVEEVGQNFYEFFGISQVEYSKWAAFYLYCYFQEIVYHNSL